MGTIALVLIHLDELDRIRADTEFGQKIATTLGMLSRRSRNKIAIGSSTMTVMSADGNDTAFVRIHGNTADRLTSEEEAVCAQALARLRKRKKQEELRSVKR